MDYLRARLIASVLELYRRMPPEKRHALVYAAVSLAHPKGKMPDFPIIHGIVIYRGRVVYVDPTIKSFNGYARRELLGKVPLQDIIIPEDRVLAQAVRKEAALRGNVASARGRSFCGEGGISMVTYSLRAMGEPDDPAFIMTVHSVKKVPRIWTGVPSVADMQPMAQVIGGQP